MKTKKQTLARLAVLAIAVSGSAQAALIDRGNGLLYDDVLEITWLQDANYAKTSGYNADGRMNWFDASAWVDDLSYEGYNDWRLPKFTGTTTCSGLNCGDSELSVMYYDNMGASASGNILSGTNTANLAMVDNLQTYEYWSGVLYAPDPSEAWSFSTQDGGRQLYNSPYMTFYVWAVRAGDVTGSTVTSSNAVPALAPLWLISSGLMALIGWKRKR